MTNTIPPDYKSETKRAYDSYAEKFDEHYGNFFEQHFLPTGVPDAFLVHLSGKKILDLGSGPGNHALYFKRKGLDVLCVDISEEMIRLCKEKWLKAEVMDMENLTLPEKSFDGVWANTSFLHIPKSRIPTVAADVARILKPSGILHVAVREGKEETFEENEKYPGTRRFFSDFQDEEIRSLFGAHFEVLRFLKLKMKTKYTFLNYLMRLKS